MKVLFVCSGNICRSPMAAAYFGHHAPQRGLSHVLVDSAGILGIEGAPASDEAILTMREIGVDLSAHRSKGISEELLRSSDLVLGMNQGHLEFMAEHHRPQTGRRLLLRAFEHGSQPDPNPLALKDPMGRPLAFYRELVPIIARCADHLILHLKHSS